MSKADMLKEMLEKNNGYLLTSEVIEAGISKSYLAMFVENNHLDRVAHGVYASEDVWADEMFVLSLKCKNIIFSHETALMLHGLMEHEVTNYSINVPRGYNSKSLRESGCFVYTQPKEMYAIGKSTIRNNFGNVVTVYDMERTICDIVKRKKKMDIQVFQTVLKEYSRSKNKNLHNLMTYAKQMNVEEQVRNYIEVLV